MRKLTMNKEIKLSGIKMSETNAQTLKAMGLAGVGIGLISLFSSNSNVRKIGIATATIGGLSFLAGCAKNKNGIILTELSDNERNIYNTAILFLKKKNPYFDILYTYLNNSDFQYIITIGQGDALACFTPNANSQGGTIDFRSVQFLLNTNSRDFESFLLEEFFHAFQQQFYVNEYHFFSKLLYLNINSEFEAKFFKLLVYTKLKYFVGEFPDIKFPEFFFENLISSNRSSFTQAEEDIYYNALVYFYNFNKDNPPSDIYKRKPIKYLPHACFNFVYSVCR